MGVYSDLLAACLNQVQAIPAPALTNPTPKFASRFKPEYVPQLDNLPQVIVATREDLAPRIAPGLVTFESTAVVTLEIYVGLFVQFSWDPAQIKWRDDAWTAISNALWSPNAVKTVINAADFVWNCKYEPNASAPQTWDKELITGSWQRFDFSATRVRSTKG